MSPRGDEGTRPLAVAVPAAAKEVEALAGLATDWMMVGAIGFIDIGWIWHVGLGVQNAGLYFSAIAALVMAAGVVARQGRGGERFAAWSRVMALYLAFLLAAQTASFLCGMLDRPFQDARFVAIDQALGFDWPRWAKAVTTRRWLEWLLIAAYFSYVPHFVLALSLNALRGREARSRELLWQIVVAFVLTMLLFAWLPAAGPWAHFAVADKLDSFPVRYLAVLRSHGLQALDVLQVEGVVTFPSFHAVYVVLLTYVHRGHKRLLPTAAAINTAMLVSLPAPGGHYLIDIIVGLIIGIVAIAAAPAARRVAMRLVARLASPMLAQDRIGG